MSDKLEIKIDRIENSIKSIDLTLAKQQVLLDEHIKRSNMLQEMYTDIKEKDIEPLKIDLGKIKGAYQLLIGLGVIATIVLTLMKIFGK